MSETGSTYQGNSPDLSVSPLLNRPIIERNYDADTSQTEEQTPPDNQQQNTQQNTQNTTDSMESGGNISGSENLNPPPPTLPPPPPQNYQDIDEFKIKEDSRQDIESPYSGSDNSDIDSDDGDMGFQLSGASAKQFASTGVDLYDTYVSQIYYGWCKFDMNNVEFHISQGNIRREYKPLLEKINSDSLKAIKLTEEEKELAKKAISQYLKEINAKWANSQNALLATLAAIVIRQIMSARQMAKENKEMIYMIMNEGRAMTFVDGRNVPRPQQEDIMKKMDENKAPHL